MKRGICIKQVEVILMYALTPKKYPKIGNLKKSSWLQFKNVQQTVEYCLILLVVSLYCRHTPCTSS